MKNALVFDIDNTLTPPRRPLNKEIADILKRLDKNTKKNRPPASTGIYRLRIEKRKYSLNLRANWYRGKIYLEYGVNI